MCLLINIWRKAYPPHYRDYYQIINRVRNLVYQEDPNGPVAIRRMVHPHFMTCRDWLIWKSPIDSCIS
jgi:hypothetical protein